MRDTIRWWENPDRGCANLPREMFFPDTYDVAAIRAAKKVCAACPVMDECLADTLTTEGGIGHSGRAGIYGGLTARQRYEAHRQARGAA